MSTAPSGMMPKWPSSLPRWGAPAMVSNWEAEWISKSISLYKSE
jgi:hypothetical protein